MKLITRLLALLLGNLAGMGGNAQTRLEAFPLSQVRLLESPFLRAQQTDLSYLLSLDVDRLLAPYLREAGLSPKKESYGNWENTGLDGHIGGHYLSALADMLAATGDGRVAQRMNYFLEELERCQVANGNGYVGGIPGGKKMWQDLAEGRIKASGFSLNDKWVPLYNIHKIYAGLIDAWKVAGSPQARRILVRLGDWFLATTANLDDQQLQTILRSEHGGLNEAFADLAAITGNNGYLSLAQRLSHRAILNPLLQRRDVLDGLHANTQIPKVIGFQRIAELTGDTAWSRAAAFFWETVTQNRTVSIGGNSVREHFHPSSNFYPMVDSREGPETCNTYNMLKLSRQLFLSSASASYMEYYERAVYNHILSSQHPDGGFVYFTPIRPRHYRVYSDPQLSFWCCVGTGLENHARYGDLIYAHRDSDLFINLFIPSTLQWKQAGLTLTQDHRFPDQESARFRLKLDRTREFALYIRRPSWVKRGRLEVRVNGAATAWTTDSSGFVVIRRTWKDGDRVDLDLPMETRVEYLPDSSSWLSFVHGPIVLAAVTDTTDLHGLRGGGSRMGHIANGPAYRIDEAPMIVSETPDVSRLLVPVDGKPFTFRFTGTFYPATAKSLELVPFYTIHDARYMIYWRQVLPYQRDSIVEVLRHREKARLALEAITVDWVQPGEQQPESDHNFRGDGTEVGKHFDRHWRTATGWFSYDLKNPHGQARKLRLTYFGKDRDRLFEIRVNGQVLGTKEIKGVGHAQYFEVDYTLPAALQSQPLLTVRVEGRQDAADGGVHEVRLVRD